MRKDYLCPKCRNSVYKAEKNLIVLNGVLKGDFFSVTAPIELNDQKDNFGGEFTNDGISIEKGALVDFVCPHCKFNLTAHYDVELSEMIHVNEKGEETAFVISNIAGKKMSFFICKDKKEVLESFGENSKEYKKKWTKYFEFFGK